MSNTWQAHEPKTRFDVTLESRTTDRPQMVSPDLKELLLAPEPRTDALTPPRRKLRRRVPPTFD